MTWLEVNEMVSEIPIVSTTFNLKEIVGAFMIEKFQHGLDFDEENDELEKDQAELERLQKQCAKIGIKPPKHI